MVHSGATIQFASSCPMDGGFEYGPRQGLQVERPASTDLPAWRPRSALQSCFHPEYGARPGDGTRRPKSLVQMGHP